MPPDKIYAFITSAFVAEILGTVGGFGSSLFFVPIAAYFLDFHSVLGITALFHVSSNLTKIALFRHGFDKNIILWVGIPAVVFVVIGAYLSQFANTDVLEKILGVFLIVISIFFFLNRNMKIEPSRRNSLLGGVFSGLAAGLLGTGGAIRGLTLASYQLRIEVFIATSAIIDLAIDASRAVVYTSNGYVHKHDLYLIPLLLVVSILGTLIGKKILSKISEDKFKMIVLGMIFLTGIFSLLNLN
jgi:uncharacterized membrane protein YfcA